MNDFFSNIARVRVKAYVSLSMLIGWAGGFALFSSPKRPVGRSSVLHLHSDYGAASPPRVRGGSGLRDRPNASANGAEGASANGAEGAKSRHRIFRTRIIFFFVFGFYFFEISKDYTSIESTTKWKLQESNPVATPPVSGK